MAFNQSSKGNSLLSVQNSTSYPSTGFRLFSVSSTDDVTEFGDVRENMVHDTASGIYLRYINGKKYVNNQRNAL